MPVFREAPRIYSTTAPNLAAVAASMAGGVPFGGPLDNNWRVAKLAARSLEAVANDLWMILPRYWGAPPMPGAHPAQGAAAAMDPQDLVTLLQYFLYVFLRAAWAARLTFVGGAPLAADDIIFTLRFQQIEFCMLQADRWIRGFHSVAAMFVANPAYWATVNGWQAGAAAWIGAGVVPSLGVVELLCRTVAEGCLNMSKRPLP